MKALTKKAEGMNALHVAIDRYVREKPVRARLPYDTIVSLLIENGCAVRL